MSTTNSNNAAPKSYLERFQELEESNFYFKKLFMNIGGSIIENSNNVQKLNQDILDLVDLYDGLVGVLIEKNILTSEEVTKAIIAKTNKILKGVVTKLVENKSLQLTETSDAESTLVLSQDSKLRLLGLKDLTDENAKSQFVGKKAGDVVKLEDSEFKVEEVYASVPQAQEPVSEATQEPTVN